MHIVFIIISFISMSVLGATPEWVSEVDSFLKEKKTETDLITKLDHDKNLDQQLKEALENESLYEQHALLVIRLLQRTSMIDILAKKLSNLKFGERFNEYFVTLATMADTPEGKEVIRQLQLNVDLNKKDHPPELKITLLSAMKVNNIVPSIKTLNNLIDDPSYELRVKTLEIVREDFNKGPLKYKELLKQALKISPYTARLKAAEIISELPESIKESFKTDLLKCSQDDQNELVRLACQKAI